MDDVTICDVRARDIRIWQINSQNFRVSRVRKIWKQFDFFFFFFFCELTGPIMGFREPCPLASTGTMAETVVLRNGLNRAYCSVSARLKCQF